MRFAIVTTGEMHVASVESTVDRERLWAAQTPQVFRVEALREALAGDPDAVAAATDEAMLVEAAGGRVLIHPSPAENLKVTTPLDLRLAERCSWPSAQLSRTQTRVAAKQTWPTPRATPKLTAPSAAAIAVPRRRPRA